MLPPPLRGGLSALRMLDEITLRGYAPSHLDAMFRLDEICFAEPFRFSKASMRRFAETHKAQVLIATHDEELAAFSIVHRERSRGESVGYLITLDVAPVFRRRGLAQHLLAQAEQEAHGAGCTTMLLHVFTDNSGAIALYENRGYQRVGVVENFYGAGAHAWMYRKALI